MGRASFARTRRRWGLGAKESAIGRRVLVTGGSGFIGAQLCRALRERGAETHVMARSGPPQGESSSHWFQADLTNLDATRDAYRAVRPQIVCHLASNVLGRPDFDLVQPTFRTNLIGTVNLLTVAKEMGCERLILTGSLAEPDSLDPGAIPTSPYAASKWAAMVYGRMFHSLYQLPVATLRLFMVYGPGQADTRKLIPYVICSLLRGERPELGSGNLPVDCVYVSDVVEAILAGAEAPGIDGMTLDVGSGATYPIRDIVERIVRIMGTSVEPLFGALGDRPLGRIRAADVARSRSLLGWEPRTTLDEGLRKTIDWYAGRLRAGGSV